MKSQGKFKRGKSLSSLFVRLGVVSLLGVGITATGCLDRPVGKLSPETTSLIVDKISQDRVDKIDLLFMVDNSASMADKQAILQDAVPDLVGRLVNPVCVDNMGVANQAATDALQPTDDCPAGLGREFEPILDIHIGVITSSLGGFGANSNACKDPGGPRTGEKEDMASLLGALPRGQAALMGETNVNAAGLGFLEWTGTGRAGLESAFSKLVAVTGEEGCGYEASLEAWYRFLVDPEPYDQLTAVVCPGAPGPDMNCRTPSGIDNGILAQRAAFLRPNSLVAVIMLTDENDCSVKAGGQAWYVAETGTAMWRAASKCDASPTDPCCYSCGQAPPAGCAADPVCGDPANTVESGDFYLDAMNRLDAIKDPGNLRCFHQKQRFGVDFLYPTQRYANALTQRSLCMTRNDLSVDNCGDTGRVVANPLFTVPDGSNILPRDESLVFLAGIVGVPWQDIVVNPAPGMPITGNVPLKYQTYEQMSTNHTWDLLLGPDNGLTPGDPLMLEQVSARSGNSPAVNEPLAPVTAGHMANSINGHEWTPGGSDDLQYACIMPLPMPRDCAALTAAGDMRACDCQGPTETPDGQNNNPLCQKANDNYGFVQNYAKAYPGIRELDVINQFGTLRPKNAVVASICARNVDDPTADDYGYRPAIGAIVDSLKEQLQDRCLARPLAIDAEGNVPCSIVEAKPIGDSTAACTCSPAAARDDVRAEAVPLVHRKMEQSGLCKGADCATKFCLCEVTPTRGSDPPVTVDEKAAEVDCQTNEVTASSTNGWCYIDADQGIGSPAIVAKCPATARRKLRFVGKGKLAQGTTTFVACLGANLASSSVVPTTAADGG